MKLYIIKNSIVPPSKKKTILSGVVNIQLYFYYTLLQTNCKCCFDAPLFWALFLCLKINKVRIRLKGSMNNGNE